MARDRRLPPLVLVPLLLAGCAAQPAAISTTQPPAAVSAVAEAWPQRAATSRLDPASEARIAAILSGMTLEQKIGQMTQAEIRSITPDEARRYYIGSILNGGGAWPRMDKHASVADWAALARSFEQAALATDMKVPVPMLWGTDAVHGHNNVSGATLYPHNIGLGAAHDPQLVERIGRATARAVRATGIGWAFAPTVAVGQNPRWGRFYESYGNDPAEVARNGAALIRGLQAGMSGDDGVIASVKHFAGDGGTASGVDQGENQASARDFAAIHGAGYYAALDADVQTVMVSYNSWNEGGQTQHGKMHGNRELVTDVLKRRLAFDGLVVSDWNGIEQVPGCAKDHCPQAVNAGIDMIMVPDDWKGFIANTLADVRAGTIPMARIDDAVTRILRVKLRMGLFGKATTAGNLTGKAEAIADRPLAQEAARKSVVLLKNDNAALPLAVGKRILVVGDAADSFPKQTGGWSVTWQGTETVNADYRTGETLLAGLRRVYGAGNVVYSADGSALAGGKFDAVLAVIGEEPHAEYKGDVRAPAPLSQSARFPDQAGLLSRVSGKGVPVVTMLYSGRVLYASDLINRSDAFVAGFLPGSEAGSLAELLAGRDGLDFSGKLPFPWPNTACPADGFPATQQLFGRNYGLSFARPARVGTVIEEKTPATCP